MEILTKNRISHLSITKDGPQSIQLNKVLKAISAICQYKHYDDIPDIISSNTKPTQEYFFSNHPIKRQHTSEHHVKLGFVNPIIELDVWSSNSPIDLEMVENTPIFNSNPQEQHQCLDYNQESNVKSQEWDDLLANKKSIMKIILGQCDEDTRARIALDSSDEYNMKIGELIKFLM